MTRCHDGSMAAVRAGRLEQRPVDLDPPTA